MGIDETQGSTTSIANRVTLLDAHCLVSSVKIDTKRHCFHKARIVSIICTEDEVENDSPLESFKLLTGLTDVIELSKENIQDEIQTGTNFKNISANRHVT